MSREIFGIAMTLFHYYTFFKSFKEFDRSEISVGCLFLACKIEFTFLKFDEVVSLFEFLKKKKISSPPDILKFEIEILNFLNFKIDIKTPYKYINNYLERNKHTLKIDKPFTNFVYNIVNDSYRKPLCLYWDPKYIALAALYIAFHQMDIPVKFEEIINYDKTVNSEMLTLTIEHLWEIFEQRIN